jgi:hypothetical protein
MADPESVETYSEEEKRMRAAATLHRMLQTPQKANGMADENPARKPRSGNR